MSAGGGSDVGMCKLRRNQAAVQAAVKWTCTASERRTHIHATGDGGVTPELARTWAAFPRMQRTPCMCLEGVGSDVAAAEAVARPGSRDKVIIEGIGADRVRSRKDTRKGGVWNGQQSVQAFAREHKGENNQVGKREACRAQTQTNCAGGCSLGRRQSRWMGDGAGSIVQSTEGRMVVK